jgi:tripartite-type tricarboxylate transporter receptor subunit TctC
VQYLQTGDMKMIMSLNNARHDYAPGVETILEAGQDIFLDPIIFLATTAGLPNDAKEALQKAFDDAMASDKVKEIVRNASQSEAINIGPKELRTQMDAGMASMKKLLGK